MPGTFPMLVFQFSDALVKYVTVKSGRNAKHQNICVFYNDYD